MSSRAFVSSAVLHGIVLTLMAVDFSFAKFDHTPPPPVLLMVDLTQVKIADKTNLPARVRPQKSPPKVKPQPTKPKEVQKSVEPKTVVKTPDIPKPKPKPQPPAKQAVPVVEPPQKAEKKSKTDKKNQTPPEPKPKPSADDRLKSLLTSVSRVSQKAPPARTETDQTNLSDGIDGGTEGDLSRILTISEQDLIASQLEKYWFVDAGKEGIEDMTIDIRTVINKDGTVREVQVLNMPTDPVKRSVAESARRAVLSCGQAGAFKILAEKYADHYNEWKLLSLRFSPLTGFM